MQPNKYMAKKRRILFIQPKKYLLLMSQPKKRLKAMKEEKDDREDDLSKLPDEILVSIMCLLTTKEAARMSVLSRRWQKIWSTTPRLTFDIEDRFIKPVLMSSWKLRDLTKEMIPVVNRVVKLHEAPTLDEFLLLGSAMKLKDSHHINTWLDFAAKRHVKKLNLQFCPYISNVPYDATLLADKFLQMHCLTDLCIQGMYVPETVIQQLLSNSPFLERFSLDICPREFSEYPTELHTWRMVCGSNLKYLKICGCYQLQNLEISAHNLNTMEFKIIQAFDTLQSIKLSALNISHLILAIEQGFKFDYYLHLLNQVIRLTLLINTEVFMEEILGQYLEFPQFSKVEHLKLTMDCFYKIPVRRLPALLKAALFLNTLSVEFGNRYDKHPGEDNRLKWLEKHIPKKVMANEKHLCQFLKVVKLVNFSGRKYEVKFVVCLLKYAVSVEKIIFQLMPSSVWKERCGATELWDYEELCLGCAQLFKTQIHQKHSNADVIII